MPPAPKLARSPVPSRSAGLLKSQQRKSKLLHSGLNPAQVQYRRVNSMGLNSGLLWASHGALCAMVGSELLVAAPWRNARPGSVHDGISCLRKRGTACSFAVHIGCAPLPTPAKVPGVGPGSVRLPHALAHAQRLHSTHEQAQFVAQIGFALARCLAAVRSA